MYKIKYTYTTGDSFHTRQEEDVLPYEWKDIKEAERSMKRIEEHFRFYKENSWCYGPNSKIEFPDWWDCDYTDTYSKLHLINLEVQGKKIQFSPPWCGYFEHLDSIELVSNLPKIYLA